MLQILIFQVELYQNLVCCILINTMRIYSLPNYNINSKLAFRASNPNNNSQIPEHRKIDNVNKPLPDWARKTMLFTLLFFAFKNSPTVQNIINPYEPTQEDIDRSEYYKDTRKMIKGSGSVSSAFYQLDWLNTIEQPKVKALDEHSYELEFKLDKQKFNMQMTLDKNNKDTIRGRVKVDNKPYVDYKAVFSPDNKDEFKILIKDKNAKCILGRNGFGELYQVRNGKRVILNNKNVEAYREYQEMMDDLDKFSFFTDKNPFWRKANYILLMLLVYLEMQHEKAKHRARQNKNDDEV